MAEVNEQRERDRLRLEACDRVEAARLQAMELYERARELEIERHRLSEEAAVAWNRHNVLTNELAALLAQSAVGETVCQSTHDVHVAHGVAVADAVTAKAEAGRGMKPSNVPNESGTGVKWEPSALTDQELSVYCLAYGAERSALGVSEDASGRAREAAHAAVMAFRKLSKP